MELDLIDTHTHLYYKVGTPELDEQMTRCSALGINKLLMPNVDLLSIPKVQEVQKLYPDQCFPMMGLHPCSVKHDYRQVLAEMENHFSSKNYCGVGEIGLDLHWDSSFFDQQIDALKIQLEWAKNMDLPVSIHCRKAYPQLFEVLEEAQDGRLRGVLHCFTGTLEEANITLQYGLFLGIGGVVTYKNAGLDKVVAQLNLSSIVLETDAPYLAPTPFRGKENESSYLHTIAEKIAEIKQISVSEVAAVTTTTAKGIFSV